MKKQPVSNEIVQSNSVFVRGLSYETSDKEAEDYFSSIGPLKRLDLIKDKEGKLKGFGFIKFVFADDAQKAVSQLHTSLFKNRKIFVELAQPKGTKKATQKAKQQETKQEMELKGKVEEAATQDGKELKSSKKRNQTTATLPKGKGKRKRGEGEQSQEASQTEKKGNKEPKHFTEQTPTSSKQKKEEREEHAQVKEENKELAKDQTPPSHTAQHNQNNSASLPTSTKPGQSMTIYIFGVPKQTPEKQLYKRLKKIVSDVKVDFLNDASMPVLAWPNDCKIAQAVLTSSAEGAKLIKKLDSHVFKGNKLILRRQDQVTAFRGDVRSMKASRLIVRNLNFKAKEADLIAAFSQFGPLMEVHIPTVSVPARRNNRRQTNQDTLKSQTESNSGEKTVLRSRGFGFVQYACCRDAHTVVKDHGVIQICGRDSAVDLAMAKKKFEDQSVSDPKGDANGNEITEHEGPNIADPDKVLPDETASADDTDLSESGGELSEEESEDEDSKDQKELSSLQGEKKESDVHEQRTVFVRNLPFDATEESVQEKMQSFGKVLMSKLVRDPATGLSKGTAFIKFSNAEQAKAAIENATDSTTGWASGGVMMGGRPLQISLAVDKNEAKKLTDEGKIRKARTDRRNLYLSYEGLIVEDSDVGKSIPKKDLEKRKTAQKEKKKKLTNPLFFVSANRLSIRNLSKSLTDHKLAQLCVRACKEGLKQGMVTNKDLLRQLQAQGKSEAELVSVSDLNPTNRSIVSAKVVKDPEKKVSKDGPVSKGYAFVEFQHYGLALAALRCLNNNPAFSEFAQGGSASGKKQADLPRLIVEFSVENHKKVKLVQERRERAQEQKLLNLNKTTPAAVGKKDSQKRKKAKQEAEEKPLSRGQRQRQKKRQLKEAQEEQLFIAESPKKTIKKSKMTEGLDLEQPAHTNSFQGSNTLKQEKHGKKNSKKTEDYEEEKFEQTVNQYKNKLFGHEKVRSVSNNNANSSIILKTCIKESRWFDV